MQKWWGLVLASSAGRVSVVQGETRWHQSQVRPGAACQLGLGFLRPSSQSGPGWPGPLGLDPPDPHGLYFWEYKGVYRPVCSFPRQEQIFQRRSRSLPHPALPSREDRSRGQERDSTNREFLCAGLNRERDWAWEWEGALASSFMAQWLFSAFGYGPMRRAGRDFRLASRLLSLLRRQAVGVGEYSVLQSGEELLPQRCGGWACLCCGIRLPGKNLSGLPAAGRRVVLSGPGWENTPSRRLSSSEAARLLRSLLLLPRLGAEEIRLFAKGYKALLWEDLVLPHPRTVCLYLKLLVYPFGFSHSPAEVAGAWEDIWEVSWSGTYRKVPERNCLILVEGTL